MVAFMLICGRIWAVRNSLQVNSVALVAQLVRAVGEDSLPTPNRSVVRVHPSALSDRDWLSLPFPCSVAGARS